MPPGAAQGGEAQDRGREGGEAQAMGRAEWMGTATGPRGRRTAQGGWAQPPASMAKGLDGEGPRRVEGHSPRASRAKGRVEEWAERTHTYI